jgi:release factor glutamine methyltransferase
VPASVASAPPADRTGRRSPVYPAREDTVLLAEAARQLGGRTVLELGSGAGDVALAAARAGARRVVATDLNAAALRELRRRARGEGLDVEGVRTDLARGLGRFDRILANPPYLPTRPCERDPDRWINLALDGGPDGCRVLARILATAPAHLTAGGSALVLVSSLQRRTRRRSLRERWRARQGPVRTVARRRLEGERLEIWELRLGRASRAARRTVRPARGTRGRRRSRPASRTGSSPATAPGRTTAPDAASGRRRSPRGS